MDFLTQLMVMWLASGGGRAAARAQPVRAPAWPTPSSPPPIPAFQPATPPKPADASHPATPLATLHHEALAPPKPKPKPPTTKPAPKPSAPKAAARAAKSFFGGALKRAVPHAAVSLKPGVPTSSVPVSRVQDVLNGRGAKLKRDGLYGPKTAASWANMAASKGLPITIKRKGPKTAEVVTQTLDALSVPEIP